MLLRAFAKINLDLRVLGRRPDGYHEIQTILQTIDWYDEIRIDAAEHFEFICHGGPSDESNLGCRAAREFERASGQRVQARIELIKRVPIGAGLGGGSADAAVMLMGLQEFYAASLSPAEMDRRLSILGSDVPFFKVGGKALATGRGEIVEPLEDDVSFWLVVVHPGVSISSAEAYSWLTVSAESHTIKGFHGQPGTGRKSGLPGNDFENVVFGRFPVLKAIKEELLRLGARQAALSGSGSALFGRFDGPDVAEMAASILSRYGEARVTRPLSRHEYLRNMIVK
jgi:4-diphosphocytidyl-2-C-methyl-D-erythritol kinase